jgi:hypothetical protein
MLRNDVERGAWSCGRADRRAHGAPGGTEQEPQRRRSHRDRRAVSWSTGVHADGGRGRGGHGRHGFRAVDDDHVVAELEGVDL